MSDFMAKMHQNLISAGALPQTPLEELTAIPRPPSWILRGPTSKGDIRREGRGRGRERQVEQGDGRVREGKRPPCVSRSIWRISSCLVIIVTVCDIPNAATRQSQCWVSQSTWYVKMCAYWQPSLNIGLFLLKNRFLALVLPNLNRSG